MNKNVSKFHPTGPYYFQRGIKAMENGDLITAKKFLTRAVELAPEDPIINCQLAIVLTECEEFERSNEILWKIIREIDPNMLEVYYFLANNYAYLGVYREAVKYAKRYLQSRPYGEFVPAAKQLLEVLALEYEDFDDLDDGETADRFNEEQLLEYQELANDLLESGELGQASAVLNDLLAEYPDYWPAYNNLALARFYAGDREEAIRITQEVLKKNPGNLHALCNLTIFRYQSGEEIQEDIAILKKIYPISFDHRYKLGVTLTMVGEYQTGYKWLKTLQDIAGSLDSQYYYWLAYAAYYSGRTASAEKAWKQFLAIHPEKAGEEPWNDPVRPDRR